jgi:hypothetical protein
MGILGMGLIRGAVYCSNIIATDQGIKLEPNLATLFGGVLKSPFWAFTPLILILIATVILVAVEFKWIGAASRSNIFTFVNEPPRNVVAGKNFINERVLLDGTAYRDCTFTNVTFVYNGTGPVEISGAHFKGVFISTDNPAVHGTIAALLGIGFIDKRIQINAPPGFRVDRPKDSSVGTASNGDAVVQSFYNSWLYPAAQNIEQVLRRVMNAMRRSSNVAIRSQEGLIQRTIADEERAALSSLSNAIRGIEPTNDEDLQIRIGRYYGAYQSCRTWIAKGLELAGVDLRSDAIFQEWLRLDEEFLDQLRQLSGPSKYDRLRELINAVGWGENITRDLRGNK